MLVLLGILVVVIGFVARINPLLVILAAAIVTGVCAAIVPGFSLPLCSRPPWPPSTPSAKPSTTTAISTSSG